MSHFDITCWTDYVRGLGSAAERERMRRHLDSGCRSCTGRVAALERMADVATADLGPAPSAAALRSVRALMALHRPERRSWLAPAAFQLLRDSALGPAPQGTRGSDSPARQMLFETDGWTLDLSVEPAEDASALALAGNCLRRGEPVVDAGLVVVSCGQVAGSAATDDLGEFGFESLPAEECELWLLAESGRPLVAALDLSG